MTAMSLDESTFNAALERHRRELHVHCYRMLGSFDEAEDALQDAFLRAWKARAGLSGAEGLRAWLYKIATNVCLDGLRAKKRRAPTQGEIPWLQPYPDRLLDEVAPSAEEPDAVVVARETIELTYMAVIQLLPPRQRAVLVLRDVLEWSAIETAEMLELTVQSANSALQRARATLKERLPAHDAERDALSEDEQRLLQGFIATHESGDWSAAAALMREDIRVSMPPNPDVFEGRETLRPLIARAVAMGEWRLVPTSANRMPCAASYLRRPGDTVFRAFKLDVIRAGAGGIAEITTFGASLFPAFGLPDELAEVRES
ncbi:RNA polymerase subunit sigma-70 [Solirubrobacter phytolaccae]|uniref:RNA polymerase subunit sigma-70 n=1 Tax=Solirubrobacter phytolaccae TaxID=1404360 RepID=A0A9X3N691_9ACTN|nr:RNA polymerase subunit sigma-70 [Solirubrobacter phytolaccae]MDA0179064.1 RNA polymerase subunit sigma-70 [Solirubrobacter phytolaccae]